ncbi:MAG TPA: hypothetical protein VGI83_09445 [Gemmatimonadales bacterium]
MMGQPYALPERAVKAECPLFRAASPLGYRSATVNARETLVTGWVATVTALSAALIAIVLLATAVAQLVLIGRLSQVIPTMQRLLDTLDRDARPALQSARTAADEATRIASAIRTEVDGVVATSKDVRHRVQRAARAAENRLLELEDILDILQDEVEETVLSVAGTLRATRRGASVFSAMKRAFLGGGR